MRDPRLVLGASDGGAHVRSVLNVEYPTACFRELVRDPAWGSVPKILETPKEEAPDGRDWDSVNLERLRSLL